MSASEPFPKARSGRFVKGIAPLQKGGTNPFFWTADLTGLWSLPDPFKDFVMGKSDQRQLDFPGGCIIRYSRIEYMHGFKASGCLCDAETDHHG